MRSTQTEKSKRKCACHCYYYVKQVISITDFCLYDLPCKLLGSDFWGRSAAPRDGKFRGKEVWLPQFRSDALTVFSVTDSGPAQPRPKGPRAAVDDVVVRTLDHSAILLPWFLFWGTFTSQKSTDRSRDLFHSVYGPALVRTPQETETHGGKNPTNQKMKEK